MHHEASASPVQAAIFVPGTLGKTIGTGQCSRYTRMNSSYTRVVSEQFRFARALAGTSGIARCGESSCPGAEMPFVLGFRGQHNLGQILL